MSIDAHAHHWVLDDALCQTHPIVDSLGRTQQATIVSEAGMYEVVIRSDKPQAVTFRRWITGDLDRLAGMHCRGALAVRAAE